MDELRAYVDALFAHRGDTAENLEMKEEIYGNLAARRDDLIAQGMPETEAVRAAKAQLPSLDGVLGTAARVNAQQWRAAAAVAAAGERDPLGAHDPAAARAGADLLPCGVCAGGGARRLVSVQPPG